MLELSRRELLKPGRSGSAALLLPARRVAVTAALLSLATAWVHLAYTASHWRLWWAYGAFFLATGAGQALFAPLVLRHPRQWVALVGIAGNAAIIGMYVVSRTAGPPLGPHAHVPEAAGAIDLATTAAEVAIAGALLTLLGPVARRRTADVLVAVAVLLWAARATGRLP
jgi:hypothetical protein